MNFIDFILRKDKTVKFYLYLEKNKNKYLTKLLRVIGIKKRKAKYTYNVDNILNINQNITKNSKELVISENKKLNEITYKSDEFIDAINFYILYDTKGQNISETRFLDSIKYIQENMKSFKNCDIGIFIYGKNIYAITKKVFNGIQTFSEIINKKYTPKTK